jgi:tRNA-dihydrouridine synthase B
MSTLRSIGLSSGLEPYGLNFPIMLAPMVGLTHVATRLMLRHFMPEGVKTLMPTEMLSTKRLPTQNVGATNETFKRADEKDLVPQILGNEERFIGPSVKKLEAWGAQAIDINMGCPVRQALKHNYGVALMGDREYAGSVVKMARRHTTLPLSVKLRAGHQRDREFLLRFCEELKLGGVNWLCLHPRLAEEKRRGHADWTQIHFLKTRLDLPIIGNGDIQIMNDVLEMIKQTNCDGVMIGRALTAKPFMLWQLAELLGFDAPLAFQGQKAPRGAQEEAAAYGEALKILTRYLMEYFDETQGLKRLRFYLHVSHPWLNYGHSLKLKIGKVKSLCEALDVIEQFFTHSGLLMSERTELRY